MNTEQGAGLRGALRRMLRGALRRMLRGALGRMLRGALGHMLRGALGHFTSQAAVGTVVHPAFLRVG